MPRVKLEWRGIAREERERLAAEQADTEGWRLEDEVRPVLTPEQRAEDPGF